MKALWLKFSDRIDAMSLRERIAVFAAAVAVLLFAVNALVLAPLFARNQTLAEQIHQQNQQTEAANSEIAVRMAAFSGNPDQATQAKLVELNREAAQLAGTLRTMQHGLVVPEKMSALMQQLLRSNGKLKLVSLRTLPVSGLGGPDAKAAAGQRELLYRHGMEVVLQGGYLDLLDYMDSLEDAPQQLFWGRAQLDARQYPVSTLTLTLYTLSLDEKWMTL